MPRPHHLFDHFAFGARANIANAVNKFAPMKLSITSATVGYVSLARAATALHRAERYTYTHPDGPHPVPRDMAAALHSMVTAAKLK